MLDHVDVAHYTSGIAALISKRAVDRETLNKLRSFRPTNASSTTVETVLKGMLSEATFTPPLPLYIGLEPTLPEQLGQNPFGRFNTVPKARIEMEKHFSVGESDQALVQIKLLWTPSVILYCWREERPSMKYTPPEDFGVAPKF